jgi:hypothetical protein
MLGKKRHSFNSRTAREAGRKSAEARRQAREAEPESGVEEAFTEFDDRAELRRIAYDPKEKGYVRVRALDRLIALGDVERSDEGWRESPQVQPGYTIPSWNGTISFALEIGAVSGPELVLLAVEKGGVHLCDDCTERFRKEADAA